MKKYADDFKGLFILFLIFLAVNNSALAADGERKMEMKVSSQAFKEGELIPAKYTCDGENISPQVAWTGAPDSTKSFALICDDPDAPRGVWVHWVLFNLPADAKSLPENVSRRSTLNNGGRQGMNDSHELGYDGPCPPGGTHRYYFKLYALDAVLSLESGATKAQLLKAMEGHVLSEGQLMGRYTRAK
ncbi:MAG TPA: YbhB/YbcL family Raf kinase inhibitor-like protein [Bacteroidota bacterium]|nr:YbhB/YbcL family Raf kinase inhibitor-like protein [Bacteroidota bacterium]